MTDLEIILKHNAKAFCLKHTGGTDQLHLVHEAMREGARLGCEFARDLIHENRLTLAHQRHRANLPQ
jgi:hypothetical protein